MGHMGTIDILLIVFGFIIALVPFAVALCVVSIVVGKSKEKKQKMKENVVEESTPLDEQN